MTEYQDTEYVDYGFGWAQTRYKFLGRDLQIVTMSEEPRNEKSSGFAGLGK